MAICHPRKSISVQFLDTTLESGKRQPWVIAEIIISVSVTERMLIFETYFRIKSEKVSDFVGGIVRSYSTLFVCTIDRPIVARVS